MNTASQKTVLLEFDDGIARLTLNRPERLNTFNEIMHRELADALLKVQTSESTRCLLITGTGCGFCAGQDLADLNMDAPGNAVADYYNPMIRTITTLNMPVIASVNGVAAGAGANLALACDIVIAARSSKFIQSFSQIGLVPDAGGTWTLPRLIGLPRATALAMTGDAVSAEQAAQWGMIWQCVDDDQLESETGTLTARLAGLPTTSLAFTKQLLRQGLNRTLSEQLDMERDYQQAASQTADFKEGVDAFLKKRSPDFSGQ